MKKFITIGFSALFLAMSAGAVRAEDSVEITPDGDAVVVADASDASPTEYSNPKIKFPRGLQFGAGVSATSGLGGFIGYANKDFDSFWWKRVGVRLDFATLAPLRSTLNRAANNILDDGLDLDSVSVNDFNINANHFGATVDIYPFGNTWFLGGWRLSGGYVTGKLNFSSRIVGEVGKFGDFEFDLNGKQYSYIGGDIIAGAKTNWNYSGPYLGTGFDLGLFWGIKIYTDFGVVFTNRAAALSLNLPWSPDLNVWDPALNAGEGGWKPVLKDGVLDKAFYAAQKYVLKDANDELNKYKYYPMIKLGLMYRF